MRILVQLFEQSGVANISVGNLVMFAIGGLLIFLAITKKFEPLLLIPIGFGAIMANLPLADLGASMTSKGLGVMQVIYNAGIQTKLLPPLIFLGVGVLTDFRPLLARPLTFLLGAAAQLGIVVAALAAHYFLGFDPREAASIGVIGGADGPTSIFLTAKLAPHLLGAVAVSAYSYMALVPVIQPPIMRLMTTKKERWIDMPQARPVSRSAVILFPVLTGVIASLAVPSSAPLIGLLMFGNLIRECGVTERLKKTAGGPMLDIVTILLGVVVGATMAAETFLTGQTIRILILGAVAFAFSTVGGIALAKGINVFLKEGKKINPCIGAAGVSAVPMSARVVQQFVSDETRGRVNPIMSAMGPNVAGVIGSAIAAGVFLSMLQ